MNRTKIEWTDFTWNPVTGCKHGCPYCYARAVSKRFGRSFAPRLHSNRIRQPERRRAPAKIFVCSMADLFGDWVPDAWIRAVIEVVRRCPYHIFQFLTKNPARLQEFNPWPANCWVGATTDTEQRFDEALALLAHVDASVRFISAEPLLFNPTRMSKIVDWVIVGAMTGPRATSPDPQWVERLTQLSGLNGIPVFHKNNLGALAQVKEFPKEEI
ncbi:MAG: DUF5131 family protein [Desulfuromonadales bacterium]|nr:DUF5131 family protein [Desulfuromonadales bacterium]